MSDIADIHELLPLYALGVLDDEETQRVERSIAADASLAAELAAYLASTAELAPPVAPSASVKARLFSSIGAGPFERFASRVSSIFDVTLDRARELLGLIDRAASWERAMPGLELVHFQGGPAFAHADCGFVRLAPGAAFPHHTHLGEEVSLIIAGSLRDRTTGEVHVAGDEITKLVDSDHDVVNDTDIECIYISRAGDGIAVNGVPARPRRG